MYWKTRSGKRAEFIAYDNDDQFLFRLKETGEIFSVGLDFIYSRYPLDRWDGQIKSELDIIGGWDEP